MRILRPAEANGVLVVEDEALVRMLVVQTLEEAGFSVRETAEAQGAMEVCAPADQARAHRADMKVLFMTGYADSGLIEKTLPEGFGLITKPFDLDDLTVRAQALIAA